MGIRDWWTPKPPSNGSELNTALEKMGISFDRTVNSQSGLTNVPELQTRWFEGKRHLREHRIWLLTIAAAIASIISAATPLVAVLQGSR